MIQRMAEVGRDRGLDTLIAPVRPTLKQNYPLTPIERYLSWRREDGTHLDPWLRTHERLGADIVKVAPESMRVSGTVAEWEEWTEMALPESGAYVVPGALVPIEIDRERDEGVYAGAERVDGSLGPAGRRTVRPFRLGQCAVRTSRTGSSVMWPRGRAANGARSRRSSARTRATGITPTTSRSSGRLPSPTRRLDDPDEPGTFDASYQCFAADGNAAVAIGTSTYFNADGQVDRVYDNVFVLRFEPSGRCSEFTEWYVKRP